MIYPDRDTYLRDAAAFTVVPVFEVLPAEFETPLSVFLKSGGAFLLESVERGENVGRYSIIACGGRARLTLRGPRVEIRENGRIALDRASADPLADLRAYFAKLRAPAYECLPPFFGGAIGYFGYEAVRYFENVPVFDDEAGVPDAILVVPDMVLIYDSVRRQLFLVAASVPGAAPEAAYETAVGAIEAMTERLARPLPAGPAAGPPVRPEVEAETPRRGFLEMVEAAKREIRRGEVIQVVLSQTFQAPVGAPPFAVYQALRRGNPSPYLFFLDFGDFSLIGSSPEVMVKVQDREMMIKPIAGTRPRGATVAEDSRLARELLADAKERAEHLMLVDLARNDLGRVARAGSVEVTDFMSVEKFSHVMHIVSTVKAEMEPGVDVFDVIRATFPAGTLTGAPKIRAMEIISDLERRRRGPYGGMVFYMGFNGAFDSCITIRTVLVRGGTAFIRAGAGIVADSVPENEYAETIHKAGALFAALDEARQGGSHGPAR